MGLTAEKLWGLSQREYDALKRVREEALDRQMLMLAAVRADLHNTSARIFDRTFEPADFMPGAEAALEAKVAKLVEDGFSLPQAVAIATSRRSKRDNIRQINSLKPSRKAGSKRMTG